MRRSATPDQGYNVNNWEQAWSADPPKENVVIVGFLTTAINVMQWYVNRQNRRHPTAAPVPERVLTDDYFEAMADDIGSRLDEGHDLRRALKETYREQGPVLLRPAPEPSASHWVVPLLIVAAAGLGLEIWARRSADRSLVGLIRDRVTGD